MPEVIGQPKLPKKLPFLNNCPLGGQPKLTSECGHLAIISTAAIAPYRDKLGLPVRVSTHFPSGDQFIS